MKVSTAFSVSTLMTAKTSTARHDGAIVMRLWWASVEAFEAIEDRLFGAKDDEVIGFEYEPDDGAHSVPKR